jgi:hypothetical protein
LPRGSITGYIAPMRYAAMDGAFWQTVIEMHENRKTFAFIKFL